MSYSIYKSIKQNSDGTFDVVAGSNNLRNARTNGVAFYDSHITYFAKEFPSASLLEQKAIWLLMSTYAGDKFYQPSWKFGQEIAHKFIREKGYTDFSWVGDKNTILSMAKDFVQYLKNEKDNLKKNGKKYVVAIDTGFFKKKTKYGYTLVYNMNDAKVFKTADVESLKEKFKDYEKYGVKFIEI